MLGRVWLPAAAAVALVLVPCAGRAAPRAPVLRLERLATARQPVFVTTAPGESDRLYVVERSGLVRVLQGGRFLPDPFLNLTRLVSTKGERGLLSIAFHLRYPTTHRVYAAFNDRTGDLHVIEYLVRDGRVARDTARRLLLVPHRDSPYHNGGQIAFGLDGRLYVGTGDGGYLGHLKRVCGGTPKRCRADLAPDPHGNAQNVAVFLGKLIRIDVDAPRAQVLLAGYGLRNPWRFSFDRATGDLYLGDVGWQRFEELDYVRRRGLAGLLNFGWSVFEGTSKRPSGAAAVWPDGRLVWPILTYGHPPTRRSRGCSASITGGYVYRGDAIRELRGRYFYGDYCSGKIWSLRVVHGKATDQRLEAVRVPWLTSFGEDAYGELLAVSQAGGVYRLVAG
jgi:glucose/arabinose dehydrogenase